MFIKKIFLYCKNNESKYVCKFLYRTTIHVFNVHNNDQITYIINLLKKYLIAHVKEPFITISNNGFILSWQAMTSNVSLFKKKPTSEFTSGTSINCRLVLSRMWMIYKVLFLLYPPLDYEKHRPSERRTLEQVNTWRATLIFYTCN